MAAVHDESRRADRDQLIEAGPDPVFGLDRVEADVPRDVAAGGDADQLADPRQIGRRGEMHDDVPAPVRSFERGDRSLAFKQAFQEIDDMAPVLFDADGERRAAGAWR